MIRKTLFFLAIIFFLVSPYMRASSIKQVKFSDIQEVMNKDNDTIYVIHFWATWCAPCIDELPEIEAFSNQHSNEHVNTLLISLDFESQVESKLIPFLQQHDIQSEVWLLDSKNANDWIPKVNKQWSGAIPVTLITQNHKEHFINGETSKEELNQIIKTKFK